MYNLFIISLLMLFVVDERSFRDGTSCDNVFRHFTAEKERIQIQIRIPEEKKTGYSMNTLLS